ncbi:MAG: dihydrodipicolinate reductase C-terminal domain-containing protein [Dehalococcoidia bacterium]
MKIALLGNGKTGGKVCELATGHTVKVFDSQNIPTLRDLQDCDVAICFLPGLILEAYIGLLIESSLPAVIGSTGSRWQDGLHTKLVEAGLTWMYAPNFSRNMGKLKDMIEIMASIQDQNHSPLLEETLHIDKVDSPSGTALAWEEWLGEKVEFIDYRAVDTYGIHKLTVETENETVSIQHTVKDRSAYAQGALDAAVKLHSDNFTPGLVNLLD